jgi:hypothetical protein
MVLGRALHRLPAPSGLRQANGTPVYAPLEAMRIKSSLQLGSTGLGPPEQQSHDPVTLDGVERHSD